MKRIIVITLAFLLLLSACTVQPENTTHNITSTPTSSHGPSPDVTQPTVTDPTQSTGDTPVVPDNPNVVFFRKVAREMGEDGWLWTFVQHGMKNGEMTPDLVVFTFYGINLRYRYDDAYIYHNYTPMSHGMVLHTTYAPAIMLAGFGPEAEARDMQKIDEFLASTRDPQELLSQDPDSLDLEVVDKELFFRLMRQAIEGDPQPEGTNMVYWSLPSWALLGEQEYIDGYKFQVGITNETGGVDKVYIDVIYETGTKYNDYIQLSDMVDNGTASAQQVEAFRKLEAITLAMEQQESYIAMGEEYKALELGGIQFSRLYDMLNNIHQGNWLPYDVNHVILHEERIPEEDVP